MNVVFVARQRERAPLFDDKDDKASRTEVGFLIDNRWLNDGFDGAGEY